MADKVSVGAGPLSGVTGGKKLLKYETFASSPVETMVSQKVQNNFIMFIKKSLDSKETPLYSSPKLRQFWDEDQEEFDSWLELFFDLIYVAMAFKLGNIIEEVMVNERYDTLFGTFFGQFCPMYSAWFARTALLSQFKCTSYFHIFLDMTYALLVAFMALFIGTEEQIKSGFQDEELSPTPEPAPGFFSASFGSIFVAADDLATDISYNTLEGFAVAFFLIQALNFIRAVEMKFVTTHKGTREDIPDAMRQRQQYAISVTSYRNLARQTISMLLTAVAIFGSIEAKGDLALAALFLAGISSIFFYFIVDVYKWCRGTTETIEVVPLNVRFVIKRLGEFSMLMLGEGVLQIILSFIDDQQFTTHLITFGLSFIVLAIMQFITFYTLPYEENDHAFSDGGFGAFLIQVGTPFTNGALIFLGVSLKLVLKEHDSLDEPNNSRFHFLLAYSLMACSMLLVFQSLTHVGFANIVFKDTTLARTRQKSWDNFYFKRIFFTAFYFLSPLSFLATVKADFKGQGTLVISIVILCAIVGLGQVDKHVFKKGENLKKAEKIMSTIMSDFVTPNPMASGRDGPLTSRVTKQLMDMRLSGRTFSMKQQAELKQGINHTKLQIAKTLMFMRDKSHLLESAISQGKALEKGKEDLESLLEHVEELEMVVLMVREHIESVVPGGVEGAKMSNLMLNSSMPGSSTRQISRQGMETTYIEEIRDSKSVEAEVGPSSIDADL